MKETESQQQNKHYSDKGGHKERSDFWKQARRMMEFQQRDPTRMVAGMHRLGFVFADNGWTARRSMRRVTRDGR